MRFRPLDECGSNLVSRDKGSFKTCIGGKLPFEEELLLLAVGFETRQVLGGEAVSTLDDFDLQTAFKGDLGGDATSEICLGNLFAVAIEVFGLLSAVGDTEEGGYLNCKCGEVGVIGEKGDFGGP